MFRVILRFLAVFVHVQAWLPAVVIIATMVFLIVQARQLTDISRRLATVEANINADLKTQEEMHELLTRRLNVLEEEVFGTLASALQRQETLLKEPVKPGQLSAAALWLRTRDAQLTKRIEALEAWRLKLEKQP